MTSNSTFSAPIIVRQKAVDALKGKGYLKVASEGEDSGKTVQFFFYRVLFGDSAYICLAAASMSCIVSWQSIHGLTTCFVLYY